ncbi:MAG TPA: hypothetical protein VNQ77_14460 [Frankiaceae bacterium]|nr:hypothetical protein [Frankiaceae bacterium]
MRPLGAVALALGLAAPQAAYAADLPLPKPAGTIPVVREAFPDRPERFNTSILPGRVDDTERVEVLLAPDGAPAAVTMVQRLVLHGTGQFIVWERSSAQDAEPLDDTDPPVLKREAVIWQGFVNERKELAARLTLDPAIERELLPLGISLAWNGPGTVGPGGALPGPGELTVKVSNRTSKPTTIPTGTPTSPAALAGPLDALLRHADAKSAASPPMAGRGLPASVPATGVATREVNSTVPFRVTGTIRVEGGGHAAVTPESPAVKHVPGGVELDGVLQGDAEFAVRAGSAATVTVDLTAYPTLDARLLQPPRGRTWAQWARLRPTPAETAAALTTLVENASAAARADEYAPYLGHHGPGKVRTTFTFAMAPPEIVKVAAEPLRPKAFPIALASLALLGILTNTTLIWRRL